MALTRHCLRTAVGIIPPNHADDLYIYFSAKAGGLRFHYSDDAIVIFSAAASMRDYARQYTRYWHYKAHAAAVFGEDQIDSDLFIPFNKFFIARSFITHPLLASAWLMARLVTAAYRRLPVPAEYDAGLYYTRSASIGHHDRSVNAS
jgi:hypothetical protein